MLDTLNPPEQGHGVDSVRFWHHLETPSVEIEERMINRCVLYQLSKVGQEGRTKGWLWVGKL